MSPGLLVAFALVIARVTRRRTLRRAASDAAGISDATQADVVGGETDKEDLEPPPPPPFEPASEVGALPPLGFFDPLGFSPRGDRGKFRSLRAAELKHGRVAMMATVGAVVQHYARLPGCSLNTTPNGIQAAFAVPSVWGFWLLVIVCGVVELIFWKEDVNKEPGDFGNPFGIDMYDTDMRNRELNNGRFAMFAAMGILAADVVTGKDGIEQLGLDELGI